MDALQAFLGANTNVEEEVYIKRLDTHIRVKALLEDEVSSLKDRATHLVGPKNNRKKEFNDAEFNGLLVAAACVNIDFNNPKMLEKYGAADEGDCVRKALFAGEVLKLQEAILTLSGFGDEDMLEEAKN